MADQARPNTGELGEYVPVGGNTAFLTGHKLYVRTAGGILAEVSPSNPLPTTLSGVGAPVALSSPPSALTANADTPFTFGSQVRRVFIQNNSATPVGVEFDAPATAGSTQIPPGGGIANSPDPCTTVHFYSTAPTPVNGSSGSNIVLKGWS